MKTKLLSLCTMLFVFLSLQTSQAANFKSLKSNGKTKVSPAYHAALKSGVNTRYLPTVIVRDDYKCELDYDKYGNVISRKIYSIRYGTEQSEYTLVAEFTYEYVQLPNTEFVITKRIQGDNYIYDAAYDVKGMLLWEESKTKSGDIWDKTYGVESVLNSSNIRTAIKRYNVETLLMEVDTDYSFDSNGRVSKITSRYEEGTYIENLKWSANGLLLEFSTDDDGMIMEQKNIVSVANAEYLNSYSLDGFSSSSYADSNNLESLGSDFETYGSENVFHEFLYNADINFQGYSGTMSATINAEKTEITKTMQVAEFGRQNVTITATDNYGSYTEVTKVNDNPTFESRIVQYNQYGDLVRDYSREQNEGGAAGEYYSDRIYERTYDEQGRPIKTIYYHKSNYTNDELRKQYEETYPAWKLLIGTGINEVATSSFVVYPNPTTGNINIDAKTNGTVLFEVYSATGSLLISTCENKIDLSAYAPGFYFVKCNGATVKVIKQ